MSPEWLGELSLGKQTRASAVFISEVDALKRQESSLAAMNDCGLGASCMRVYVTRLGIV